MNQKQKHFKTCRTFPVLCTNKCGRTHIPREELEAHILDECPATEVQCEYKNLGCEEVFPRSAAKSHAQTQIESHLSLALRGLEATQDQVHGLVIVVKEQSQQIEKQSQQIERQSQQIERQSQQIELQSQKIVKLISKDKEQSQQIERQSQQIKELISKDKEQSQQIERQSQQIKKLISKDKEQSEKMERPMTTAQEQPLQREGRESMNQIFPTPCEWKIYAETNLKTLFCEAFYLFKGGYRYKMKVSSLSPYVMEMSIKVVPGEFDDSLSWPCKEKLRVNFSGLSNVIDFEKGKKPCSRPLHDNHHEYRLIAEVQKILVVYHISGTFLLRVSRE